MPGKEIIKTLKVGKVLAKSARVNIFPYWIALLVIFVVILIVMGLM